MGKQDESLWTAEANWWNVGKLVAGFFFLACFCRAALALVALLGGPAPVTAFPELASAPAMSALYYGAWSITLLVAFRWLEAGRRAAAERQQLTRRPNPAL